MNLFGRGAHGSMPESSVDPVAAFAPVIHPTLETGVRAMTVAALDALAAR